METLITVVKVFHVAAAAAWFGHKLLIPADIRTATAGNGDAGLVFLARMERAQRLGLVSGVTTLLTGILLIVLIGPTAMPLSIYLGLVLVVGMFIVGATRARPAWLQLRLSIVNSDRVSALKAGRALSQTLNIESTLWVAVLALMLL